MKIIPHTKPTLGSEEAEAAKHIIMSGLINDGAQGELLCYELSAMCNTAGGVTASTGTHALILALRSIGIKSSNDEVIIPDFSCRAIYDAVRMAGALPVFCDIGKEYTLLPESVKRAVGKNTKAVILTHMFGQPSDFFALNDLGIPIIEDCAHSPGAEVDGKKVGGLGRFSIFSLEGSKFISAGEGGVVLAKSKNDLKTLKEKKMHGEVASQSRLSDIISSVGIIQLKKLSGFIERRRVIANYYYENLRKLEELGSLILPPKIKNRESIFYRFVILVSPLERNNLIEFAEKSGIFIRHPIRSGCLSAYLLGKKKYQKGFSEEIDKRIASLPIYPLLTDVQSRKVVNVVLSFFLNQRSG